MDRNLVALFVRVVETGSFTRAAAQLGLPKSSVSRGVARLEEDLGVALLRRTTRALSLTAAGRAYFERVKGAIATLDDAATEATAQHLEPRGHVRLTAPVDIGEHLLAPLVTRFVEEHRSMSVELVLTSRRVDLVSEGIDLAVRAGRLDDSSLIARRVGTIGMALYASQAYLARAGRPRRLADLVAHACVLFRAHGGRATWTLDGPRGPESVDVRGAVSADDLSFVRAAVADGAGIGLLPTHALRAELEAQRVVRVLPDYAHEGAHFYVLSPASRFMPVGVAALRDRLVRELAQVAAASRPRAAEPREC